MQLSSNLFFRYPVTLRMFFISSHLHRGWYILKYKNMEGDLE